MIQVLCIEDEPLNIRLVQKMLNFSGYQVAVAETGSEGIEKALAERPSVILLDINLPDINGFEVARILKSMPETAHIPIIALTALTLYRDRQYSLEMGCDDYLPKPTSRIELVKKIQHHLAFKPLLAATDLEQDVTAL